MRLSRALGAPDRPTVALGALSAPTAPRRRNRERIRRTVALGTAYALAAPDPEPDDLDTRPEPEHGPDDLTRELATRELVHALTHWDAETATFAADPYRLAHARVHAAYGSATAYRCAFTGEPADEWACVAPEARRRTAVHNGRAVTYSESIADYRPASRAAHRRYDAARARARRTGQPEPEPPPFTLWPPDTLDGLDVLDVPPESPRRTWSADRARKPAP